MRIHLITQQSILDFATNHADSRVSLYDWLDRIRKIEINTPEELKLIFPSVDILGGGSKRLIFDINGNKYRLICQYVMGERFIHLYVCWIGSHSEYDKICKAKKQYSINIFR